LVEDKQAAELARALRLLAEASVLQRRYLSVGVATLGGNRWVTCDAYVLLRPDR